MNQLFTWGGQSTGASALASFLRKKSQGWSPSECTGWISLQSKGLSRVFSNTTVQKHQFFGAQPSSQSPNQYENITQKKIKPFIVIWESHEGQICPQKCFPLILTWPLLWLPAWISLTELHAKLLSISPISCSENILVPLEGFFQSSLLTRKVYQLYCRIQWWFSYFGVRKNHLGSIL